MPPLSWLHTRMTSLPASIPHICLWSPHLLSKPSDWPPNVTIAGYTSLTPLSPYDSPTSLQSFLQTSNPILAISFGSMNIPKPAALLSILSSALTQVQAAAIISRSWPAHLEAAIPIPSHIHITNSIPHAWLLPRVTGFIHHGGAGHTAAGLRAGVPMLLMPFLLDQFFWAAKVHELGLSPAPLSFRAITTQELLPRLQQVLSGRYQDACAKMAARVQEDEDGADTVAHTVRKEMEAPEMNRPCAMIPTLGAQWRHADSGLLLSGAAAAGLVACDVLRWEDLDLCPKIDWAARWQEASPSLGWLNILGRVTAAFSLVLGILYAALLWLSGFKIGVKSVEETNDAAKARDPVRRARIEQAEFDWQLVKRDCGEKGGMLALEEKLAGRWRALAASKFWERFENGRKDHDLVEKND